MITRATYSELDAAMAVVRGETMTDEKKPEAPPMWRCYRADDGVYQCHPSGVAGWPDDVSTLCGREPGPLIERAQAAMAKVAAPYIAAELRRLAEECRRLPGKQGNSMADLDEPATAYEAAMLLCARADELDPPRGG